MGEREKFFRGGGDFWPGDTENIFFGVENEFWVGLENFFLGGFNNFFGGEFAGVDPPKKKTVLKLFQALLQKNFQG